MTPLAPHPGSAWVFDAVAEALDASLEGRDAIPVPSPDVPWEVVLEAIERHRVAPLLAPRAASLGMPSVAATALTELRLAVVRHGLRQVVGARAASDALAAAGIPALVVKGVALAALMGQEPAARGAGDVDVLVDPVDLVRAESVMRNAGWNARRPVPLTGWRRRMVPLVLNEWVLRRTDAVDVDLHWRLQRWRGEFDDSFDALSRRAVDVPAVGPNVRTLAPSDAMRHLAAHGRKEMWPTLRHLVDVVLIGEQCGDVAVGALVRADRSVAQAAVMAARLAPRSAVGRAANDVGLTYVALADEAMAGCRSLELIEVRRTGLVGRPALDMRWRTEQWWWRSAPSWRVRAAHLVSRLMPWNALAAPGPWWLSYRDAVRRAFRGRGR